MKFLHFGLYKNGRAIDPLKVISVTKTALSGKKKEEFMGVVAKMKTELDNSLGYAKAPMKLEQFDLSYTIQ